MNYDFYDNDMILSNNLMPVNNINTNYKQNDSYNLGKQEKNNLNLFSPYNGYMLGNAFNDEYVPYKNYKVIKDKINNEKDEMLINIGEYEFMAHELNLYLDLHPNDRDALEKFQEYTRKCKELTENYERKYGPLMVSDSILPTPFSWEEGMWPFNNK